MGLVTVTVAGELGEITARVDADSPIGAHLGKWARQCSTLDVGEAALVDLATSAIIGPDDTLAAHRIGYGSRLRLVASRQPLPAVPHPTHPTPAADLASSGGLDVPSPPAQPRLSDLPTARRVVPEDPAGSAWPGAPRPAVTGSPAPRGRLSRRIRAARATLRRQAAVAGEAFALPEKPSAADRWRAAMEESDRIRQLESVVRSAPLARTAVIAVVSPKGGVGKSTLTALMGTLLAELRSDPVICVDANPDFGNLADKLSPPSGNRGARTDELQAYLAERGQVTPAELNQHLGIGPHGVRFVASPTGDPARMIAAADFGLYQDLIRRLQAYAGVILLDCGTGFLDPPVRAALDAATEIVLVTDSSADTARLVVGAAGYLPPATPVWLAANKMPRRGSRVDLDAVRAALAVRAVVVVPERPLAENVVGPQFDWGSAPSVWQEPLRELVASIAGAWPDLGGLGPRS